MISDNIFYRYKHAVETVLAKRKNEYTTWQIYNESYSMIRIILKKESPHLAVELANKLLQFEKYYQTHIVWNCHDLTLTVYILDDNTTPIAAKASATAKLERVHAHQIEYILLMREAIDAVKGLL